MKCIVYSLMKMTLSIILSVVILSGCRNKDIPDVSDIKVSLEIQRFEKDFFALDTNHIREGYAGLSRKYPVFLSDFTHNILALPAFTDTSYEVESAIRKFIHDYRPIMDSVNKKFPDISPYDEQVKRGLQFVKYYFSNYQLPKKLITFIGPMDAYYQGSLTGYGDVITTDALAIGLQLHMGHQFSLYTSEMGQSLYPAYISSKFAPQYIPVNCMENIIDDLFPDNSGARPLLEQMVEKGKRVYLLDRLLPETADTLKLGYTLSQLKGCISNEGLIWNYFLTNGLLNTNDASIIKNYIGDSPGTPEFGEGAPGNIGLFIGWQIVKKYMDGHEDLQLGELMKTDPRKLYEESKYRPR